MGRPRRIAAILLRPALSALLLFLVLRKISFADIVDVTRGGFERWPLLLLAASLPGLGLGVRGLRWRVLLAGQRVHPPFRAILEALLIASFFNLLLPSTIGGDIARSHRLAALTATRQSTTLNLAVVGLDRVIGVLGTIVVAILAAALSPSLVRGLPEFWIVVALVVAGLMFVGVIGSPAARSAGRLLFARPVLRGVRDKAVVVHEAIAAYRSQWTRLAVALGLSVALQLLVVLEYSIFAVAIGVPVSIWEFSVIVPIVTVVEMIPITIGGLGLRESALTVLGRAVGLRPQDAVALAWLFVGTALGYALLGWLTYAVRGQARRGAETEAAVPDRVPRGS